MGSKRLTEEQLDVLLQYSFTAQVEPLIREALDWVKENVCNQCDSEAKGDGKLCLRASRVAFKYLEARISLN